MIPRISFFVGLFDLSCLHFLLVFLEKGDGLMAGICSYLVFGSTFMFFFLVAVAYVLQNDTSDLAWALVVTIGLVFFAAGVFFLHALTIWGWIFVLLTVFLIALFWSLALQDNFGYRGSDY